jgi:hypothetical protein
MDKASARNKKNEEIIMNLAKNKESQTQELSNLRAILEKEKTEHEVKKVYFAKMA